MWSGTCTQRIVLLKLTTNRHETSCVLSATTGLLVYRSKLVGRLTYFCCCCQHATSFTDLLKWYFCCGFVRHSSSLSWFFLLGRCTLDVIFHCGCSGALLSMARSSSSSSSTSTSTHTFTHLEPKPKLCLILTRGQSNLTKSASWGPIPQLGVTLGGRNLYHWIPGVGVPISVP